MPADLNELIAARVRELRARRGMTIQTLAEKSGVSRSMISLVERAETSPTAVVLEKLATGLGVMLASLFDAPAPAVNPVSRRSIQREWMDPASGYVRRNISPPGFPSPIQIVEVTFPPGQRVAYESSVREEITHQQVWVLQGTIEIQLGSDRYELKTGDCFAMVLDRPITYVNSTAKPARYAVVIASGKST